MDHEHGWSDAPLRFDRRGADRWSIEGTATVFELGGEGFGRTHALTALDYSAAGIGAISATAIAPGAPVTVGFESPGYPARRGTVARCLPCGRGYRLAVAFENRLAA